MCFSKRVEHVGARFEHLDAPVGSHPTASLGLLATDQVGNAMVVYNGACHGDLSHG